MPAGIDVLITPLSADNRHRWTGRVPSHTTDNPSARKHRAEDRPAARISFHDTDNGVASDY